jgi:hypothetical protein
MDDETQSYTTPHYGRSAGVIGHRQFGHSSVGAMQIVCGVYAKDAVVDALAVFWDLASTAVGFGGYAARDGAHRASRKWSAPASEHGQRVLTACSNCTCRAEDDGCLVLVQNAFLGDSVDSQGAELISLFRCVLPSQMAFAPEP